MTFPLKRYKIYLSDFDFIVFFGRREFFSMDGVVYSTDFWLAVSAVIAVAATNGRIGKSAFKGSSRKRNCKKGDKDKND